MLRLRIALLMLLVVIVLRDSKGRSPEKKIALLLDFVQIRGGGPCPFLAPFHKCIFGQ